MIMTLQSTLHRCELTGGIFAHLFWLVDRVIHSACVNAIHLHKEGVRPGWAKRANRHQGRKRFQIDAGLALMECRTRLDWEDVSDESTKPEWMRQADHMPCNCGVCFFCKEGETSGIDHECQKTRTEKKWSVKKSKEECTTDRVSMGNSDKCDVCYHKRRRENPNEPSRDSSNKSRSTRKGCKGCNVHICKHCWPTHEHKK